MESAAEASLGDIVTESIRIFRYSKRIKPGGSVGMTKKKRKAFVDAAACVACGCCVKVCPKGAVQIYKGITAQVDMEKCVGCGRCARECPASVIESREVKEHEA